MVALWVVIGLALSAVSVSTLGATFSIFGLRELFAGAAIAICAMAASLELAKFVLAAYLHQRWKFLNILFKTYLVSAVVVLSLITSMGIFGFLSNAYQSASNDLDTETTKLESLKAQIARDDEQLGRLNKALDEIPATRVTKKMLFRAEIAPELKRLADETGQLQKQISAANLSVIGVKQKVGPLIYISRAFNLPIDAVVKYLIMVFVSVFDPLAICLVIATSESLEARKKAKRDAAVAKANPVAAPVAQQGTASVTSVVSAVTAPVPGSEAVSVEPPAGAEQVLHMRFADEAEKAS